MTNLPKRCDVAAIVALLAAAGCASKPDKAPLAIARATSPAAVANFAIPGRLPDGGYATINHDIGPAQAIWHLRSALNVAALACRGAGEAAIVADYNALLDRQRAVLKAAYTAVRSDFRRTHGDDWQSRYDAHMTRLYNFFAYPLVRQRFCEEATAVGAAANTTAPAEFQAFAVAALTRLEAPFIDFYRARDNDRRALASSSVQQDDVAPAQARSTVTASVWRVQLGAFGDREKAQAAWMSARGRIAAFAPLGPTYELVPAKNMIRLRVGPLVDRSAADSICAVASAAGQACFPVAPSD